MLRRLSSESRPWTGQFEAAPEPDTLASRIFEMSSIATILIHQAQELDREVPHPIRWIRYQDVSIGPVATNKCKQPYSCYPLKILFFLFYIFVQTKLCVSLWQSRKCHHQHSRSTLQAKSTTHSECPTSWQCRSVPRFAHPMRHSILHGRRHRVTWISETRNNSPAADSFRIRSIMFRWVSSKQNIELVYEFRVDLGIFFV